MDKDIITTVVFEVALDVQSVKVSEPFQAKQKYVKKQGCYYMYVFITSP